MNTSGQGNFTGTVRKSQPFSSLRPGELFSCIVYHLASAIFIWLLASGCELAIDPPPDNFEVSNFIFFHLVRCQRPVQLCYTFGTVVICFLVFFCNITEKRATHINDFICIVNFDGALFLGLISGQRSVIVNRELKTTVLGFINT